MTAVTQANMLLYPIAGVKLSTLDVAFCVQYPYKISIAAIPPPEAKASAIPNA